MGSSGRHSLPLVRIPIVRRWIDALPLIRRQQFIVVVHPHATAHDLAHTRHQAIHALRHAQVGRVFLHVKRLDLDGEMRQEDRPVDDIRHLPLRRFGDIVAERVRLAVFVEDVVVAEPIDSVGVRHPHEGAFRGRKVRVQLLDVLGDKRVSHDDIDDAAHDEFEVFEQVVEGDEVELGLDVRVFG